MLKRYKTQELSVFITSSSLEGMIAWIRACPIWCGESSSARHRWISVGILACVLLHGAFLPEALAEAPAVSGTAVPSLTINSFDAQGDLTNTQIYSGIKLAFFLSSLVFIPSILMCVTCFLRLSIVLSLTRQALGTTQTPPNQIILGLALFLTFAIMQPVFNEVYTKAILPFSEDQIGPSEALAKGFTPLRAFMVSHTREQDIELFLDVQKLAHPAEPDQLPATVVIPAFVVSELNTAFQISFLIFLPFLVLDMIISSILTSMSMITLPPTVISLPIKLMLFVIIDGWHLIIGNLVQSYKV